MFGQSPLAAVKGAPLPRSVESWVNSKAAVTVPLRAWAIAQSLGIQLGKERGPELLSRVLVSIHCQSSNSAWLKNKQFHQQTLNLKHSGGECFKTAVWWVWREPRPPGSLSSFGIDFLSLLPWGNLFFMFWLHFPQLSVCQGIFFLLSHGFELAS